MKDMILDTWCQEGTNVDEFKETLKAISERTLAKKVQARDVTVYSKNEDAVCNPDCIPLYLLDPKNLWEKDAKGILSLRVGDIKRERFISTGAAKLIDEFETSSKLMLSINNKIFFTSRNLSPTLGLRTDMKGESAVIPSLERDLLTAKRLNNAGDITFIIRRSGVHYKIFAAMSGSYAYVPQSFLADVIDRVTSESKLGAVDCKHWSVDNQLAEVYLEFPEKAEEIKSLYDLDDDVIPGMYLAKSDVGECSITIRATWRINNSVIISDEIKRKHTGKAANKDTINEILEDVDKIVFAKYTQFPDKLLDLMETDITQPEWTSLTKGRFESKNHKAVCEAIKTVFKEIGIVSAIGKKQEKAVYEQLCREVNDSLSYTAYDVVMMTMQLAERLEGLSRTSSEALAKACSKAPFVKFDKPAAKKVVLTA